MNFVCGGESRKCDPFPASVPVGAVGGGIDLILLEEILVEA